MVRKLKTKVNVDDFFCDGLKKAALYSWKKCKKNKQTNEEEEEEVVKARNEKAQVYVIITSNKIENIAFRSLINWIGFFFLKFKMMNFLKRKTKCYYIKR